LVALGIGFITPTAWARLTGGIFNSAGSFGAAFSKGFASGLVASKGDLDDALIGGLTAGAFDQVGNEFVGRDVSFGKVDWAKKSIAHGAVGGISSTVRGGDFVSGFLSAGVAEASLPLRESMNLGVGGNLVATTIIGGSVSEISGGNFANGAATAAFGYLFNCLEHEPCASRMERDSRGGYLEQRWVGSAVYSVKLTALCGNMECKNSLANLDQSHPGSVAYLRAAGRKVNADVARAAGTIASGVFLVNPASLPAAAVSIMAPIVEGHQSNNPDPIMEAGLGTAIGRHLHRWGLSKSASTRATEVITTILGIANK
jgi:hypothetical protein